MWWEQPFRLLGLLNPKAFTVVAKTVTWEPVIGNYRWYDPWTCVRQVRKGGKWGLVNAIGLTNDGIRVWVKRDYRMAKYKGYKIAASVKPNSPTEAAAMAILLSGLDLAYIEMNVSCPNTNEIPSEIPAMLRAFKRVPPQHPIVLKLSESQVTEPMVRATEEYVDAFHGINTIPWSDVFPDEKSPIEGYPHQQKGGVSGDHIRERAIRCIDRLRGWTKKPLIGGGGISKLEHVLAYEICGADAFSIGSAFPLTPWVPNSIVREYEKQERLYGK